MTAPTAPQAEMSYDGLGNRLSMTGHAVGQSVTTQYFNSIMGWCW